MTRLEKDQWLRISRDLDICLQTNHPFVSATSARKLYLSNFDYNQNSLKWIAGVEFSKKTAHNTQKIILNGRLNVFCLIASSGTRIALEKIGIPLSDTLGKLIDGL